MVIYLGYVSGIVIGSVLLFPLIDSCCFRPSKMTVVYHILLLLITASVLLNGHDVQDIPLYIGQFFLVNAVYAAPYNYLRGAEFLEKAVGASERYIVMNFMRLARELLTAIFMAIIGILMSISTYIFR